MDTNRLEAFSDGVIAILITIMVLELRAPHGTDWSALANVWPALVAYVLSFIYLGIYWSNHHHMLQLVDSVNGGILWANLHLLFWLSLVPFTTQWVAEAYRSSVPAAVYGVVLLCGGIAYTILQETLISSQGEGSRLKAAVGHDAKGRLSAIMYAVAIPLAFVRPVIAYMIYLGIAISWLVPDRRIERVV